MSKPAIIAIYIGLVVLWIIFPLFTNDVSDKADKATAGTVEEEHAREFVAIIFRSIASVFILILGIIIIMLLPDFSKPLMKAPSQPR